MKKLISSVAIIIFIVGCGATNTPKTSHGASYQQDLSTQAENELDNELNK